MADSRLQHRKVFFLVWGVGGMRKGRRIRVVFFYKEFFLGFGLICKSREGLVFG